MLWSVARVHLCWGRTVPGGAFRFHQNSHAALGHFVGHRHTWRTMSSGANGDGTNAAPRYSAALTSIDVTQYDTQLEAKLERLNTLFGDLSHPRFQVHRSEPEHYRMRTEFKVFHRGQELEFQMFDRDPKTGEKRSIRVDQFPVASRLCNQIMKGLLEELPKDLHLRTRLFQVNIHTTLSGQAMVTLLYHTKLNDTWKEAAAKLRATLAPMTSAIHIIGRSRGQKICLDADEVEEVLDVDGRALRYVQIEANFSQPNAGVAAQMLAWASRVTAGSQQRDLLELYCGNGNFTVAVAPNFRHVAATELSKASVAAARRNCQANGADTVFLARMRAEEFTEAWKTGRQLERLKGLDLAAADFQTLLVDPPRAGLDPETLQLLSEFDNIVYISCNPETLHANLKAVQETFEIKQFAVFDQFPWTHHIECGVYLEKTKKTKRGKAQDGTENGPTSTEEGRVSEPPVAAPAAKSGTDNSITPIPSATNEGGQKRKADELA